MRQNWQYSLDCQLLHLGDKTGLNRQNYGLVVKQSWSLWPVLEPLRSWDKTVRIGLIFLFHNLEIKRSYFVRSSTATSQSKTGYSELLCGNILETKVVTFATSLTATFMRQNWPLLTDSQLLLSLGTTDLFSHICQIFNVYHFLRQK